MTTPGPHAAAVYIQPLRESDFAVRVRSDDPDAVHLGGYRCDIDAFLKALTDIDVDVAYLSGVRPTTRKTK